MITNVTLKDFKCFLDLSLEIKPLTLLTGFNAAGKSTAIQALLAVTQTTKEKIVGPEVTIDGSLISLGSTSEIINDQSSRNFTFVKLHSETESIALELNVRSGNERQLSVSKITKNLISGSSEASSAVLITDSLREIANSAGGEDGGIGKTICEIVYISATRDGAPDIYTLPKSSCLAHADVGSNGQFAAWWFAKYIDEEVAEERCNPSDSAKTFRRQFNAWASSIFPGMEANASRVLGTDFVKLEFRSGPTDKWRRPSNIGYGLSYVFPILVACLLAKKGQTIVIDSPEAHLHPLGQSKIGFFLAKMAECGVQVIIETHSDHILNGVRIAVKQSSVAPENVLVHFFQGGKQEAGSPPPIVTSLVSVEGSLSDWPEGFFDQAEKDLAELAGWNDESANNK